MELQVKLEGNERLQQALAKVPEAVTRRLMIGMKAAVRDVAEQARTHHRFISRTGALEQSITETVAADAGSVYGLVELNPAGTRTASGHSYGLFQHEGTDAKGHGEHFVEIRYRKALRWVGKDGRFVIWNKVDPRTNRIGVWVRGIKPDPFLYNAADTLERNGLIQAVFDRQVELAIKEAGL